MIKIGIPATSQPEEKFGVNSSYLEWAYNFGRPVIILPERFEDFREIYTLDAILLPGGADVNSSRYSNLPSLATGKPDIYLEHFDNNILPHLIGKMPIFGICRGLQTLNVSFGGTLRNLWLHPYSSYDNNEVHWVWKPEVNDNDRKKAYIKVNSFHHQAIGKLAGNFTVQLEDKEDKVIEAISDSGNKIFAVQWHPERLLDRYSIGMFNMILK